MKLKRAPVIVLLLALSAAGVLAQMPDFSGKWKLEAGASSSAGGGRGQGTGGGNQQGGGLGIGPSADDLTIVQTASSLTIDEHWASGSSSHRVYPLDGKQANNPLGAGRGAAASSVSTWVNRRLVTTLAVAGPNGSSRELQETRYLDDQGRLIVETTAPGRPNSRKSVYNRVK